MSDDNKIVMAFWKRYGPVRGDAEKQKLYNVFRVGYLLGSKEGARLERNAIVSELKALGRERDAAAEVGDDE
jgi:hypothetical protein